MTRPEDQESQVVDPYFDQAPFMQSSPPTGSPHDAPQEARHGHGSGDHLDSDDRHSEPDSQEPEAQHDSLGSRIDETQFDSLYPETQVIDESQPSFQNPSQPSQSGIRNTSASAATPTSPAISLPIERPKVDDPADDAGFRFGKARTFFSRQPGKAPHARQPASSACPSKQNPINITQPKGPDNSLPPMPIMNQSFMPSGNKKVGLNIDYGEDSGASAYRGALQVALREPVHERVQVPLGPRLTSTTEAANTPLPEHSYPLMSPYNMTITPTDPSLPYKSGLRSANRSNRRSSKKHALPFPEVVQQPRGRSPREGSPAVDQQVTHVSINPPLSADVNAQLRNTTMQSCGNTCKSVHGQPKDTCEQLETIPHGQSNHPDALAYSQMKAQRPVERVASGFVEASMPGDLMSALEDNKHSSEVPREGSQVPHELEQTIFHQNLDADRKKHHSPVARSRLSSKTLVDIRSESEGELQHPFRPPSQPRSRSQSVLSNTHRILTRPLVAEELVPEAVSDDPTVHFKQSMRVQKSNSSAVHAGQRMNPNAENLNQRLNPISPAQTFRQTFEQVSKELENYTKQKILVELQQEKLQSQAAKLKSQRKELENQQSELESLQATIVELEFAIEESNKQIKLKEDEKAALAAKVRKFGEISAKYKAHMNDVVVAQKHLMKESFNMRKDSAEIRDENKAILKAFTDRESHERRIRSLIDDSKTIPPMIEKAKELEKENAKIKTEIENMKLSNVLLQSDLEARMVDLGRERHNNELLQKSLNALTELHKELVAALNKAQPTIVDELTKEGSLLASLANSENSIQAKIDELSSFVNTLNNREPDLPPALIKLIEDLYTRIEGKIQSSETNDVSLNEYSLQLFGDLKERINQLRLDDGAKASFHERISELRESNATLTACQTAKELECQGLSKRIEEMERKISGYRDQLTAKAEEISTLRAIPKEGPILLRKIQDLENAKTLLQGQLNTANQETSKAKEEVVSYREMALSNQKQAEDLQSKLAEAKASIVALEEEKKKYIANHRVEVDKACQEIAKASKASKAEAQLKYDCRVKNLEQRVAEAERELGVAQEKLQKSDEKRGSDARDLNRLQKELSASEKKLAQQAIYIKHTDQRSPPRDEFERREKLLREAQEDMVELKAHLDNTRDELSKLSGGLATHEQQTGAIIDLIQKSDLLEKDKVALEEQNCELQKKFEALTRHASQYLRRNGVDLRGMFVDEFMAADPVQPSRRMGPPAVPMPKSVPRGSSSTSSNVTPSHPSLSDDPSCSKVLSGTPMKALCLNEQKQYLSTQGTARSPHEGDVTPRDDLRTRSKAALFPNLHPLNLTAIRSSSPHQATPKQLRPAHRKSSGFAQSVQTEKSSEFSRTVSATTSVLRNVPSMASVNLQTPINMTFNPAGPSSTSSIHGLSSSEDARPSATSAIANRIEISSTAVHTSTTRSFSAASLLSSSSPLSEIDSPIDQLDFDNEELGNTNMKGKAAKSQWPMKDGTSNAATPVHSAAAFTGAGTVHFKSTPPACQFSDEDSLSGLGVRSSIGAPVPTLTEESSRRRQTISLKSAMKKGSKNQKSGSANDARDGIHKGIASIISDASQKPSSTIANSTKQDTRGMNSSIGSSYNRIVSGSKPDSLSEDSGVHSVVQQQSATSQNVTSSAQSPLMRAPERQRKRSVYLSESKSQPMRPFKKARVSLPNQGQRSGRTIVPDSQDAVHYRR